MRLLAVLLLMTACGGGTKPPTSTSPTSDGSGSAVIADPIPRTAGPDCAVVADKLAIAAAPDRADEQAKVRRDATARCREDRWSDDARSCFAAVENEQELEGCIGMLTAQQQAKLRAADEGGAGAEPVAPTKAATPLPPQAPPAKKKPGGTRSADPEEGGE